MARGIDYLKQTLKAPKKDARLEGGSWKNPVDYASQIQTPQANNLSGLNAAAKAAPTATATPKAEETPREMPKEGASKGYVSSVQPQNVNADMGNDRLSQVLNAAAPSVNAVGGQVQKMNDATRDAAGLLGKTSETNPNEDEGDKRVKSYWDLIQAQRKEDEEEKKKQKKRQIINAIGDGLSAMSNLYFTSKGAPNAYDKDNSAMARSEGWYQKMREQRLKDGDRMLANQMAVDKMAELYDQNKWQRGYYDKKLAADEKLADAAQEYRNQRAASDDAYKMARIKLGEEANKLRAEANKNAARKKAAGSGGGSRSSATDGSTKKGSKTFGTRQGVYEFDPSSLPDGYIKSLFEEIPSDIRDAYKRENFASLGKSMTPDQMWSLVQSYAMEDDSFAQKLIRKSGAQLRK